MVQQRHLRASPAWPTRLGGWEEAVEERGVRGAQRRGVWCGVSWRLCAAVVGGGCVWVGVCHVDGEQRARGMRRRKAEGQVAGGKERGHSFIHSTTTI